MSQLSYSDIFKPGTYPEHTYISRITPGTKYTYEQRLEQSLKIEGFLTSIVGPSKTGKTVLCDKVIGLDTIVSLSGNDFKRADDFWNVIAVKTGISMKGEFVESNTSNTETEGATTLTKQHYLGSKDRVVQYFKAHHKVLILDDFHYAPKDMQYDIACQLKDVIRTGFRAVVISLPHRSDDTIRSNPDLMGRVSLIEIDPWTKDELEQIAVRGFEQLGIPISGEIAARIALESINSPLLMQSICFNMVALNPDMQAITHEMIEDSCRFTCINYQYKNIVQMLQSGPSSRGQKRVVYQLATGETLDIYAIILKVLAQDPPHTCLDSNEIKNRVDKIVIDGLVKKPTTQKIKEALNKLQNIMEAQNTLTQVFEWKDNCVYILDPLFLFYLRWSSI
ncbi:MAG: ATP-binding protein [Cellulosilyticaceae bacterium]